MVLQKTEMKIKYKNNFSNKSSAFRPVSHLIRFTNAFKTIFEVELQFGDHFVRNGGWMHIYLKDGKRAFIFQKCTRITNNTSYFKLNEDDMKKGWYTLIFEYKGNKRMNLSSCKKHVVFKTT